MSDPVVIVDYDPQWPAQFEWLASRVRQVVPAQAITAIEHIGSTAVPGLVAKPIIDLDVVIPDPHFLPLVIGGLATVGYGHQGELGIAGRDAFQWPAGEPRHHLYVCARDSQELHRHVLFRDYLRTHPWDAAEYAMLKRQLAERFSWDRLAYNEAKTEFVQAILMRAGDE